MHPFENPPPISENDEGLIRAQWYGDAGVGRGVDPEVAADLGYAPPQPPKQIEVTVEAPQPEPSTRTTNHHPRRRQQRTRRGLGAMGRLTADEPSARVAQAIRADYLASEAVRKARQMIDDDTSDPSSSEIV